MGHTPRVIRIVGVLVTTIGAATVLAATAAYFWLGDLAVHFRPQYIVLAMILFALLAASRRTGWAATALCIAAVNVACLMWTLTALAGHAAPVTARKSAMLRVASINVFHRNREFQRVIDFVRRERPDVLVLVEVNAAWRQAARELARDYPHMYLTHGTRARGVMLLSRWPIDHAGVLPIQEDAEPAIRAMLHPEGRAVEIFAIHARWPAGPATSRERNRQLARIATFARSQTHPLLVIGDLNISPLSPHFLNLLEDSGLRVAGSHLAWQPTWPRFLPPAGIQIDHALVSADLGVLRFERGPGVGSDHLPILLDVVLP